MCASNNRAANNAKQMYRTEKDRQVEIIIVDFNIPFLKIDRTTKHRMGKGTEYLKGPIKKQYLINS